jgi:hypothetical protein
MLIITKPLRAVGALALMTALTALTALAVPAGPPASSVPAAAPTDAWASGDPIRAWTALAMTSVADTGTGDAGAARTYAMIDAAMYDAVNALLPPPRREAWAIVPPRPSAKGDPAVAAATAAHDVLAALYPQHGDRFDAVLDATMDSAPSPGSARHGAAWGRVVAAGVLAARTDDGSSGSDVQPPSTAAGQFDQPWNTQPRHLAPFVISDPAGYVGSGPPPLDSPAYAAAFAVVKELGDASNPVPGADATFRFWSLGTGTEQPPGAWLTVAAAVSTDRSLSLASTARLFALTSMAMADTVAPTYETKARYHSWRPAAAIPRADADGNPDTVPAQAWVPRGGKSGSPEYWSGHSSFSAAAATALAAFFGSDDIAFRLSTGSSAGAVRSYSSFSDAANEAGFSRVLGGLHFPFSNAAGLEAGRRIAEEVVAAYLSDS